MPRKAPERLPKDEPLSKASMRPRHRCRGKYGGRTGAARPSQASMRPRHRCRGKRPWTTSRPRRCAPGFNEAAASMPRKAHRLGQRYALVLKQASMRPRHRCRGKPGELTRQVGASLPASMRPRHRCRGKLDILTAAVRRRTGFNEAAASMPRKDPRAGERAPQPLPASMRPRHRCRGKQNITAKLAILCPAASMRPRHRCRGK